MQQKAFSLTLSHFNSRFVIKDKKSGKQIRITKVQAKQSFDSTFWRDIHLRIIDQKELTLFDHSLKEYISSDSLTQEVWQEEQFGVNGHLTIEVYATNERPFTLEVNYELSTNKEELTGTNN